MVHVISVECIFAMSGSHRCIYGQGCLPDVFTVHCIRLTSQEKFTQINAVWKQHSNG